MEANFFYLLLLLMSPLTIFAIHMITGRLLTVLRPQASALKSAVWAVAIGFFVVAHFGWHGYLSEVAGTLERVLGILYGIVVYIFLAGSYYILFAMTEAARRIKILQELYHKGDLTVDELDQGYGPNQLVAIRLERLLSLNQLEKRGDKYCLKGKLLYYVSIFVQFWGRVLKFSDKRS